LKILKLKYNIFIFTNISLIMKVQIFSDLHLEHVNNIPKIKPLCEIIILGGDIGNISISTYEKFIEYCSKNWTYVLVILGNHEFYNLDYDDALLEYTKLFEKYENIILLNNSSIIINDYMFIGSIFWTTTHPTIQYVINDFNQIQNFTYEKYNELHQYDNKFLTNFLKDYKLNKNLVVITHFPPTRKNVSDPKYKSQSSIITNYFANELDNKLIKKASTWIYGHTHWSNEFNINSTKMISNQMGYFDEINKNFNSSGLYEI